MGSDARALAVTGLERLAPLMPTTQFEQKDFSVGQLSDDFVWSAGLAVRGRSLRTARNVRLKVSGAAEVRPGTVFIADQLGDGWVVDVTIADVTYFLVFTAGSVRFYDRATRAEVPGSAVNDCPWTAGLLPDLAIVPYGNQVFVLHAAMPVQVLRRSPTGAWSRDPFVFSEGVAATRRQPYYRFAEDGVTVTPNQRDGVVTLTTSAPYWVAGHVGTRVRLQGRELQVTSITSPTVAVTTAVQLLYETVTLPVASSNGFEIGEIVEGKDTKAKGEVVGIPSGTSLTVLMQNFNRFTYTPAAGSLPAGEGVVGVRSTTVLGGAPVSAPNAAVLDWDEQAISALRGYPATGAVHKNRLWFGRLPSDPHGKLPFALLASAVDDFEDFDTTGAEDNDAIFEFLGDANAGAVVHIVSSEQLLVVTSRRLYYYPESETNPIRPTSFQLLQIGPDGGSDCVPVAISEGVLFASFGGGAVMGAFPTGDIRRSWRTVNMSYLTKGLLRGPRDMAYIADADFAPTNGDDEPSVRYAYIVNGDGTMAVLSYTQTEADSVPGWTIWDTDGRVRSVAAVNGECWALVARQVGASTVHRLEVFDSGGLLDSAVSVGRGASYQRAALPGENVASPSGQVPGVAVHRCAGRAGRVQALSVGGVYAGQVQLDGEGDFPVPDVPGFTLELGHAFSAECGFWPPVDDRDEGARRRKKRIVRVNVRWRGRGMVVNGQLRPLYDGGEDVKELAPVRDELSTFPLFGFSYEPTFTVGGAGSFPAFWTLLGASAEVAG